MQMSPMVQARCGGCRCGRSSRARQTATGRRSRSLAGTTRSSRSAYAQVAVKRRWRACRSARASQPPMRPGRQEGAETERTTSTGRRPASPATCNQSLQPTPRDPPLRSAVGENGTATQPDRPRSHCAFGLPWSLNSRPPTTALRMESQVRQIGRSASVGTSRDVAGCLQFPLVDSGLGDGALVHLGPLK